MNSRLPYGRQMLEEDDISAVVEVLRGDWLTTGPKVVAFEAELCNVTDARHAVACANGTAALHLAVLALDLAPGDRVIVPSVTFLATANAVRLAGGEVTFADCDPESGLMEVSHLAEALEHAANNPGGPVKAVMPVHLAGQCADLTEIYKLAAEYDLAVVDDAAHAIGSRYRAANGATHPIGDGRLARLTTFSFHPVKTITMGEGGAVTTHDDQLADRLRRLRSHGMTRDAGQMQTADLAFDANGELNPWYYEMPEIGLNYRVTDVQCALGLSQLKKLGRFVARRRALVERYDSLLAELSPFVRPIRRSPACESAWHIYPVLIDFAAVGLGRAELMQTMKSQGIGTQVHYIPVHLQPYYRQHYGWMSLPGAEAYYAATLSLPLFVGMADSDVDRVVETLEKALRDGSATLSDAVGHSVEGSG